MASRAAIAARKLRSSAWPSETSSAYSRAFAEPDSTADKKARIGARSPERATAACARHQAW